MKTSRTLRRIAPAALLIALPMALVGCSSGQHAGDIDSIRWDPSPAMHTLAKRDADQLNTVARMKDANFRMISTDVHRIFHLERPSRLHHGVKP